MNKRKPRLHRDANVPRGKRRTARAVACAGVLLAGLSGCGGGSSETEGQSVDLGSGITMMADGAIVVASPRSP
jgi:hypothetical protein